MPALACKQSPAEVCNDDTANLSARLVSGEEAAWREFHARTFDRLLRYLLIAAHGNEEAAREAIQIAYVKCVRHVRRFEIEGVMWGWLAQIARGCLIDLARRRSRYAALLQVVTEESLINEQPRQAASFDEHLAAGLARLTPSERALIEACYLANQPIRQIAQARRTTPKAIESRLARIRFRLRAWLTRAARNEI
ncbi:MAG: hypothetical protein JWL90_2078 [Chthoniobacteraceae bacterium]|nr:hypothetical protein [Chthoniobacteraceae bacterium]